MSGRTFFDSNVLVYLFETIRLPRKPEQERSSRSMVARARSS
jgi:hypothetical protein